MELELGLKITKTRDDNTFISEYQLAKDRAGPVFHSRETSSMFILTAHLKGYKRNKIHIKINEDGSKISISGEKPIQEMLMMGWVMFKKDVEITSFNKVFKIPDGVILDWIKAKYDEEECMLKIVMPKSVKGICGARIEEVKEDKSDRGRSELESSVADHIPSSFGERTEKGSKECEVQEMKDSESVMEKEEVLSEKMLDDANVDRNKDTIKTEIEESNLGIKDGSGTSVREKAGRVENEAMKTSDLDQNVGTSIPQNTGDTSQHKESEIQEMEDGEGFVEKNEGRVLDKMLNGAKGGLTGETIQKEIEDENGASVREKGGKAAYEAKNISECEQKVSEAIPQSVADTSRDKESEIQEMEDNGTYRCKEEEKVKMVFAKMLDDSKGYLIGEKIEKEIEESKLGVEGGDGENVRENDRKAECEAIEQEQNVEAHIPRSIGHTSQESSKESVVQQMQEAENAVEKVDSHETGKMLAKAVGLPQKDMYGKSKEKEFEQPKSEIEDMHKGSVEEVSCMERFKDTKTSELDQNVADHIPSKVGGMDQEESRECGIQKMKKTESIEGNMDGRESERMPVKANNTIEDNIFGETISTDIKKPNETVNGDEECEREKAGKEGFEAIITAREEFPEQLPEAPQEESKELNVSKMKGSKEVTETMVKRKGKEIECSKEKGEGEEPTVMHVEARTLIEKDIKEGTRHEEIEKPKTGIKGSDQQGGFKVLDSIITEELPTQVGEKVADGSKGFKDEKIEKPKKVTREAKAEAERLMENVEGETSKETTELASRDIKKSTETLRKADEESDIERRAKDGSYVPDIIVEGSLDVTGTIQAKVRKKVVEAMVLDENDKTNCGIVKLKGEGSIRMNFEANKVFEQDITRDRTEKEIRVPKLKSSDQLRVEENIDNGGVDVTKRQELPEVRETEDSREKDAKTEQTVKEVNREKYEQLQVEADGGFRKDIPRETSQKDIMDPKIQTKGRDQSLQPKMDKGKSEANIGAKEESPMKIVGSLADKGEGLKDTRIEEAKLKDELVKESSDEKERETEHIKDGAEAEQYEQKEKEERYEKIQVETKEGKRKDKTRETTRKETKEPEIQTKHKHQQCLQEEMSKRRPEASKAPQEEFLVKRTDSLANERERLKDTMPEKAKEVQGELVKQQSEEQMEEAEDAKDKGAKTERSEKKEKGEKYEKIQVEASGGLRKGINRETTPKETKEPNIQTEDKDQQCLQDAMSEGRFEASTTRRELPLQIMDSPAKRRDGTSDKKIEETGKVKQEVATIKIKETNVAESTTKGTIHETDGERITKTSQEVPKEEHPEALDIELNEKELQTRKSPTTNAKEVRMGYEGEQGRAKKQKTKLLSPTIQSKETLESRNESAHQDIVRSKKAKEAEKGEQCNYNTESTKAVTTIEDQVAKPRFPSTQQFEVGEGKLQEGPSPESQKEYHTKDLQDSIEMKDQESQHKEVFKPEVPLEEFLKKGKPDTRKDEFQKKTMQEEIEQPNDDGDQQYVQPDVGKEVETVEVLQREMPKEEYASNAGPTAGRMETERDLEATPNRDKDMTENVNDEKLRIKEEINKTDFAKIKEKEHRKKSKAVEKEADPLEAIASLPFLTSIGVKNGKPEPHHKDLSPLTLTAEAKSEGPPILEQPITERELPKPKEYVSESRNRKQYGYGTENITAPKSITYKGAKPSEDEDNRKSENVVEKSPKENTDTEFQESIEWVAPIENEYVKTFQARILENQGSGEKQEVYGQEAEPYQERKKEGSNGPNISSGDRGQQYAQEDNHKKGYQATKAINEELLSGQHRAEQILLEEREVPEFSKTEEPKDSSKQLHERKKGKTIQIAEDKMPETEEMTRELEKANGFKQEAERIQEPTTTIEIAPKKGMEESRIEEMSPLRTEIQREERCELSWPSMATQQYQVEEEDKTEASDEVGNQESRKEDTNTNVQYSNKSETDQKVEQVEIPQPKSFKDQLCTNKDEEESQRNREAVGEMARKLQEEEECEVVIVAKEETSGENKDETKRTKKLFVPLVGVGSTLLVSLVYIFVHRKRARKRCNSVIEVAEMSFLSMWKKHTKS